MYPLGMSDATDLLAAVTAGDAPRVQALLAEDPTLANARDEDGVSALLEARYRNDRAVLDALLAADPDMDVFDAAALGHIDRLRHRLEEDASRTTAFAGDGFTALHLAAFFGKVEAARILLDAGASVATYGRNDLANQPLHAAAAGRHIEVCRILLAAGADVTATQHGGFTPLHEAAQSGDVELTELFLSAGADPRAVADDGRTAATMAADAGHVDLAARLREVAATRATAEA
jgi:ankyrin repeat protein